MKISVLKCLLLQLTLLSSACSAAHDFLDEEGDLLPEIPEWSRGFFWPLASWSGAGKFNVDTNNLTAKDVQYVAERVYKVYPTYVFEIK